MRAIALVRVVIWHAFGAAVITYVVAAVPAMVFVSGSLLARSLRRRRPAAVIGDRLRRLLVPYWAFAAVALAAMAVARVVLGPEAAGLTLRELVTWLVPVVDPVGTDWQAGWLTSPLWYVRLFLWLLVLAVPIRRAVRTHPLATVGLLVVGTFATDVLPRHLGTGGAGHAGVVWYLGDLALYGSFFALGMLHGEGRLAGVSRPGWAIVAGGAAVSAAAWVLTQPVPEGIVNHSHPAHLLVGLAWLAAAMAAQPLVARLAHGRGTGPVVAALARRSLTVYLWHSTAIICTYRLLWASELALPPVAEVVAVLTGTVAVTVVLVMLTGWVEDRAAGRPPSVWPFPLRSYPGALRPAHARPGVLVAAAASLGAGLLAMSLASPLVGPSAAATPPPAPSRQPDRLQWVPAAATAASEVTPVPSWAARMLLPGVLASIAEEFRLANEMPGIAVGVLRGDGFRWSWATGSDAGGSPMTVERQLDIASITKSFTAALVWREIEAGRLALDAPLPAIDGLPGADRFTVRDLLGHRSGLVGYRPVAGDFDGLDVRTLLARVLAEPLEFEPGSFQHYSSSNALLLGVLLEEMTGRSYEDLLRTELLEPLGLDSTFLGQTLADGWATGGIHSTVDDLLDWGAALLRDGRVVDRSSLTQMTTVAQDSGLGDGLAVFCPCVVHPDGRREVFAVGMYGAVTRLSYAPSADVVVVVELTVSQWDIPERPGRVDQLVSDLATAARRAG